MAKVTAAPEADEPDFEGYEKAIEESIEEKSKEFEELKKKKLVISLYGPVNSGKSSVVNALTGQKLADVRARAGWTTEVALYRLTENAYISDTPGLDDITEENSKRAEEFVEQDADIIIFFLNASVGTPKSAVDAYNKLHSLGKPIIVVLNKIDTIELDEQRDIEQQIQDVMSVKAVPISAKKNIGIDLLHREIMEILESKGKDLLYVKTSKFKDKQADVWINGAAVSAAGVGAIPIPIADMPLLTGIQVGLAMKIAYIYDCEVTKEDVMQLVAATVTGGLGRQIFRWGIQGMKGLGWVGGPLTEAPVVALAGIVAASVTYGFGHACKTYYKGGMTLDLKEVGKIFRKMQKKRQKSEEDKQQD